MNGQYIKAGGRAAENSIVDVSCYMVDRGCIPSYETDISETIGKAEIKRNFQDMASLEKPGNDQVAITLLKYPGVFDNWKPLCYWQEGGLNTTTS